MKKFKVKFYNRGKTIRLPYSIIEQFNMTNPTILLKIGYWTKKLRIKIDNTLNSNEILLPSVQIPFTLPIDLLYEINYRDNILHIGPIIGMLVSKTTNNVLNKNKIKVSNSRLQGYHSLKGLVFICSIEDIDLLTNTINGYYYNPNSDGLWVKGNFPLPDSMYNRLQLPEYISEQLIERMGNTLFNSRYFDKNKLWELCSKVPEASKYVPDTLKYTNFDDLQTMLSKYQLVYIKPISGKKGKGIIMAKQLDDNKTFSFQSSNGLQVEELNEAEARNYLYENLTHKKGYILQQAINTKYENKKLDFRFYFQKSKQKMWICQGVVGRIAKENSIVTNYKHLSTLLTGIEAVQLLFNISEAEANSVINDAIKKCQLVCDLIDKGLGHFGDIAIDVVLDQHRNPYILEINNRIYATKSLRRLKLNDTFYKIRTTPLEYAKSLAGFH